MFTLFGRKGWGSAIVEAQLVFYGLPYVLEDTGDLLKDEAARARLRALNPLAQTPTLVLPGGRVMTESAAITLHLADITGRDDLVPGLAAAERAAFLRWLVFLVANIYPTFTYADIPDRFVPADAARAFRHNVNDYAATLWQQLEDEAGAPWFLGPRFSALDIYLPVMTRWRPGRDWFAKERPRLAAIVAAAEAHPALAEVLASNIL